MANVNVTFPQLAQAALATISTATVKADDHSLALLGAVKNMLRGIQAGTLLVSVAAPPRKAAKPGPANARGGTVFSPERGYS